VGVPVQEEGGATSPTRQVGPNQMNVYFPAVIAGLLLLAPVLSAVLVLALIPAARRFGLVDHPGGRKQHDDSTPLVGGLAIFLAFVAVIALTGNIPGGSLSLLAALTVAVAIGTADDAFDVTHRSKFVAQIAAALIIVSGTSVQITHFGDLLGTGDIALDKWSVLVTVVAIIGVMNAVNMIDGLDGLAGSVVLPPLVLYAWVAGSHGDGRTAFELLALAGATAGFLFFNLRTPWRRRALVFMGDTGGLVLGLLLAWYSMLLAGKPGAPLPPIAAVWVIGVPLVDMSSVMLLRLLRGRSPFHADRQHMHYVLLDAGFSVAQVVAIMTATSAAFGLTGLLLHRAGAPEWLLALLALMLWGAHLLVLAQPQRALRWIGWGKRASS
jgi:UDP-GlcNAc:undecaprenyl-phosphate GlcNAc-1-phosphate transferase